MHQRASDIVISAGINTDLTADAAGLVEALLALLAGQSYPHWGAYKRKKPPNAQEAFGGFKS